MSINNPLEGNMQDPGAKEFLESPASREIFNVPAVGTASADVPHLTQAQFGKAADELEQTSVQDITKGGEPAFSSFHEKLWQAGKDAINHGDLERIQRLVGVTDKHILASKGGIEALSVKLQSAMSELDKDNSSA